jgi:hypothetical protein
MFRSGRGKDKYRCKGRRGIEWGIVYMRIAKTKHASAFALWAFEIPPNVQ